jgi:deazaflavin-dependent oxidoreductase (nitroreductase family)
MVEWLIKRGVPMVNAHVMAVRGRSTGQLRHTPVNPLVVDGTTYLVAPRGHVQWTRNLRAVKELELTKGRKVRRYTASEVPVADRPHILRTYRARFRLEVAKYFAGHGITAGSTEEDWLAVAHHYPVFVLAEQAG